MANAFVKAQFMEPPSSGVDGAVPIGAVKAGPGITISNDGIISLDGGSGIINEIICTNGIVGGGSSPQVIIALAPPTATTIGGVKTIPGSNISIDSNGVIRSDTSFTLTGGLGVTVNQTSPDSAQVSVRPAGSTNPATLGGIYRAGGDFNGLDISPDGGLSLLPATAVRLGGIKPGTGVSITSDGTLNATGSGGTITGVGAGTGLGGGGTSGAVTLFLRAATPTTIGGVYPGTNVTVDPDGRLNVSDAALGVLSVNQTPGSAIVVDNTDPTNPLIGVTVATTSAVGVSQLSAAVDSTSTTQAATPSAVKQAYDLANGALPVTGGPMLGPITFTPGQTFPGTVASSLYNVLGGILVSSSTSNSPTLLTPGSEGQVLTVSGADPLGVAWKSTVLNPTLQQVTTNGATTNVATTFQGVGGESNFTTTFTGRTISMQDTGTELLLIDNQPGGSQTIRLGDNFSIFSPVGGSPVKVGNRIPGSGSVAINGSTEIDFQLDLLTKVVLNSTGFSVNTPFFASGISYPTADGVAGAALVTDGAGTLSFSDGFLQKAGGTMTGLLTFAVGQTFPGVLTQNALSGTSPIVVGGTASNPIISVDKATIASLGVVQPDGTSITIDGNGVISAGSGGSSLPLSGGTMTGDIVFAGTQAFPGTLPLAGGTMTGTINFAAGQTISGYVSNTLYSTTGDIAYASSGNTPARLGIGAAGSILAVNAGLPSWRTTAQLGLLTSASASSTYAPLDSPTFTGPATINAGGSAGSNALTLSGGNLVLSTTYTPPSSSSTGTVGELAWDNSGYLYFCYAPNTWGRVQIDLTPF